MIEGLRPGAATGIGSLPHRDPGLAAAMVLDMLPDLPAVPQLPKRSPYESMLAQWASIIPGIRVARDGSISLDRKKMDFAELDAAIPALTPATHGGLLSFVETAALLPNQPRAVKAQTVGPLTLGVGLAQAGLEVGTAFALAGAIVRAGVRAIEEYLRSHLPSSTVVIFVDEPALVIWKQGDGPIAREDAIDILSGVLAASTAVMGVHVCGEGDRRMALAAGPTILATAVSTSVIDDAAVLFRHLEAGGWVAWGAVPTGGPVGESTEAPWRRLATLWCDLTRHGCDPELLRTHALVTPACGLVGHSQGQAKRMLRMTREIGERTLHEAVATRLTAGG